jgi:hypothetical protein
MFHRGGALVRDLTTAFSNQRMDSAQDPLQLARATIRTLDLDSLFCVPEEQLCQFLTSLADELVYGQTVSSLLSKLRSEHGSSGIEDGHDFRISIKL